MKGQPGSVNMVTDAGGNYMIVLLVAHEPAGQRDLTSPTVHDGIRNLLQQRRRISEHVRGQLVSVIPLSSQEQKPVAEDNFINKLYALVEEHLDEPLFGVDQLLSLLDMSRTSLHRKIKALSNMSTTELVRNYRLQRAASFLLDGKSSTDTAYMSGFSSPSYFTKCFREQFGVTPGEFLEKHKNSYPNS